MAGFNSPDRQGSSGGGVQSTDTFYLGAAQLDQLGAAAFANIGNQEGMVAPGDHPLFTARPPKFYSFGDADKTIPEDATFMGLTATLTAPRILTLPPASHLKLDWKITVADIVGGCSATNFITLLCQGSDLINGFPSLTIAVARGERVITVTGTNRFSMNTRVLYPANNLSDVSSTATAVSNLGLAIPDVQIFTTTGAFTWTKPTGNYTWCEVVVIAGGGGGGSGARTGTGVLSTGGAGGGGGGYAVFRAPFSTMASSVSGSVGAGGTGGAAVTVDTTAGNPGTAGGTTNFGSLVRATGGNLGNGGSGVGAATGGSASSVANFIGASGASSDAAGGAGVNGSNNLTGGAAGGASGGGITTGNVAAGGGTGGNNSLSNVSGGAAGTSGGNGTAGTSSTANMPLPGSGGGGGAAATAANAGAGGAGGKYGAGGAGGGASRNGFNSGAGGNGADGICIVRCF